MLTLRPATPDDAPEVARIWTEGWADGHLGHVPEELVAVRTPESFLERAANRIGDTTIGEIDGVVVGFVMIDADEAEQVYVDRAARGTGAAGVLLAEAARQIGEAGHTRAWLAVAAGNDRAYRFYEREGWVDEGLFDYVVVVDDRTISVDCHRMVKDLTTP